MSDVLFEASVDGWSLYDRQHQDLISRWLVEHGLQGRNCRWVRVAADSPTYATAEVVVRDEFGNVIYDGNFPRTEVVKFPIAWYPT